MSLALCLQPTDALWDLPYFQKGTKIRWYQRVEQTWLGVWSVTCPSVTSKGDCYKSLCENWIQQGSQDGCLSFLGGRFTAGIKTLIAVVNGQLI